MRIEYNMKPLHDWRCRRCDNTFEARGRVGDAPTCLRCGCESVSLVFLRSAGVHGLHKDPYDALDRVIPDSKPIKSFANDKRKGGKDTT